MALVNSDPGAPIEITIGRKGQRPDFYPARIVGPVKTSTQAGRRVNEASVIYLAKTLAGEHYLAVRENHNLAFAFDRNELCPELDGSMDEPKTWQQLIADRVASAKAFLMSLPETGQVVEAADLV